MIVECYIKKPAADHSPQRSVTFDGWSRTELLQDLPRLAAALDVDLMDLNMDTLVLRIVRK